MEKELEDYEKQWPGLPIKYLILAGDFYIVFLDRENDIDWKTNDDYDEKSKLEGDKSKSNCIFNEIAFIESIPCDDLDEKTIVKFKRQIGEALVRNFEFDYDNAHKMLQLAKEYIIDRNSDKSRYLYLKASGITTISFSIIASISWIAREYIISFIGENSFFLLLSFLVGSLGAFLSIILRIGNSNLDYNASKKLHYMEGISKIAAGMISAFLVALCIKAGILLPIFNKIETTHLTMILGGLIAGSSERLAPSIIKKLNGITKE